MRNGSREFGHPSVVAMAVSQESSMNEQEARRAEPKLSQGKVVVMVRLTIERGMGWSCLSNRFVSREWFVLGAEATLKRSR